MKIMLAAAVALATLGAAATAHTADPMAHDTMTKMPAAAMKKVDRCKAMTHDAMTKNKMCMKMMRLYPDAFAGSVSSN